MFWNCWEIFLYTGRYEQFSNQHILQAEKIANVYLVYKKFKKNNIYVTYCFMNSGNHDFLFPKGFFMDFS